ncbi:DUF2059 domain-containing protein [Sphingomonas sp. 37zxx]|uniref:DUF2059 domain-containing protein n=1 Tax=Sphingomonas sp. 37zxx TaxID=1550073 RepID=UPI00053C0605|nr:DUF2059 domain-containing protein [Sphingomonas sp. 37zxx]
MKRAWLIAVSLSAAMPAAAQISQPADSARLAAAQRLLDKMDTEATLRRQFEAMAPGFAESVVAMLEARAETRDTMAMLIEKGEGGRDRLNQILAQEFMASMAKQFAPIKARAAAEYAAAMTVEELEAISAFYATGPGAKALEVMPELQRKMIAVGQELGRVAGAEAGRAGIERAQRVMLPSNSEGSSE